MNDTSYLSIGQSYNEWDNAPEIPHLFQRNLNLNSKGEIIKEISIDFKYSGIEKPFAILKINNNIIIGATVSDTIDDINDALISILNIESDSIRSY